MWLCSKLTSATFILALTASIVPCYSISVFKSTQQMDKQNSVGYFNYDVRPLRTSGVSEARFFNFGSIGSLGSYFTKFYRYFESGMNVLWGFNYMDGEWGAGPKKVSYKRHQLLRVIPRTDIQVDDVLTMREELEGLMFWTEPARNHSTDILVPPDLIPDVKEFLQLRGLEFIVLLKDVQVSTKQDICLLWFAE